MFDKAKAEKAVRFIELLSHTGDFHGQRFELFPWERQIVWDVFGTMNKRGLRQYRTVYIEIPKKNGKSELVGGLAVKHLFDRDEPNGEIYGCAGDRSQASIIFDTAVEMIMQEPTLADMERKGIVRIRDSYKLIENRDTGTTYKVLSAESFTKHGYRPSIVLFDELHVQPNRDLWDVMTKGSFLARRQPLLWVITTAGDDPDRVSIGWEIHEKAQAVIKAREAGDKKKDIETWYPIIYSYQGEDIYNEKNWFQANPSLGLSLQVEDLREIAAEAKLSPADERTFRWLNLNQWITTKLTTWLPIDLFDMTVGEWSRNDLLGAECYIGGDFSTTTDLSATCLVFPPQVWTTKGKEGEEIEHELDEWRCFWDCWIPEDNMRERVREDHVPYDKWAAQGWLTPTPGDVIDYRRIEERFVEYSNLYRIKEAPFDPTFATMLIQRLREEFEIEVTEANQSYQTLTDPMNHVEVLLRNKRLTHEANPVARWCFGNTSISKNGNAQIKYVKERKGKSLDRTKRIDLTVALVLAMQRARFYETNNLEAIMSDEWGM